MIKEINKSSKQAGCVVSQIFLLGNSKWKKLQKEKEKERISLLQSNVSITASAITCQITDSFTSTPLNSKILSSQRIHHLVWSFPMKHSETQKCIFLLKQYKTFYSRTPLVHAKHTQSEDPSVL